MNRETELKLLRLQARRRNLVTQGHQIDAQLGALAEQAIAGDTYTTQQDVAAILGVSRSQVQKLLSAHQRMSSSMDDLPGPSVTCVDTHEQALEYVAERGLSITRSISAFQPDDVLFASDVDPRAFPLSFGRVSSSCMMWQLDTADGAAEWIAIRTISVGYGGTGPEYAGQALEGLGLSKDLAQRIASYRYCDAVDLRDPSTWVESRVWPVHGRTSPFVVADRMVVPFGEARSSPHVGLRTRGIPRPERDETGFYPSALPRSEWESWIDYLDQPDLPSWARGPRVARVFLDPLQAREQGFISEEDRPFMMTGLRDATASVVVEQGMVQLWGFHYPPQDKHSLITPETADVLFQAGVYSPELEKVEHPIMRLLRTAVGQPRQLPGHIDISPNGDTALSWTPGNEVLGGSS